MKKTEIKINLADFPSELHHLFQEAKVYDSSSSDTMQVLYSELGYYIKIAGKGALAKEAELTKVFFEKGMGVEVMAYLSLEKDYMVTRSAKGEDALHYLENPEKLCEVLAAAMKYLHSLPITDVPLSPCMDTYESAGYGEMMCKDTNYLVK